MKREAERCWGTDKCARLEVGPGALPVRASGWLGSGLGGAGGGEGVRTSQASQPGGLAGLTSGTCYLLW